MPGNSKKKCKQAGNLCVKVRVQNLTKPAKWEKLDKKCAVHIDGGTNQVDKPDATLGNNETFKNLCAGGYGVQLTPHQTSAKCDLTLELDTLGTQSPLARQDATGVVTTSVTISDGQTATCYFRFYVFVLRVVVQDDQGRKIPNLQVKTTAGPEATAPKPTDKNGLADFGQVLKGQYTLDIDRTNYPADVWQVAIPSGGVVDALTPGATPYQIVITPPILRIILLDKQDQPINALKWECAAATATPSGTTGPDGLILLKPVKAGQANVVLKVTLPAPPTPPSSTPSTPSASASDPPPYPPPIKPADFKDQEVKSAAPDTLVEWTLTIVKRSDFQDDNDSLKRRLHNLGFNCDAGATSTATTAAVKAYQRHLSQTETGLLPDVKDTVTTQHDNP